MSLFLFLTFWTFLLNLSNLQSPACNKCNYWICRLYLSIPDMSNLWGYWIWHYDIVLQSKLLLYLLTDQTSKSAWPRNRSLVTIKTDWVRHFTKLHHRNWIKLNYNAKQVKTLFRFIFKATFSHKIVRNTVVHVRLKPQIISF